MKKRKVRVLFIAYSGDQWMGGVYYVKNIVFQFLEYAKTQNEISYEVYVLLDNSVKDVFDFCSDYNNVKMLFTRNHIWDKGNSFIPRNLRELCWILRVYMHRIDYIFPSFSTRSIYRKKIVSWIPDFQHVIYPEFFSEKELHFRDGYFKDIAENHSKLVLSSQDSFDTYKNLYPSCCNNVGVVHFVSALQKEDIMNDISPLLEKYEVGSNRYFIVSNQFYRHKNHLLLFEAIKLLRDSDFSDVKLICTGMPKDNKDPSYYQEVDRFLKDNNLYENIKILGLIPRKDQLSLMNASIAVIQPSLFEGWGTCTEDAKVLGKITVLSDIPVHQEQADDKSLFFKKDDVAELAEILRKLWNTYRNKSVISEYDIKNAVTYGKQFADLLEKFE